VEAFGGIVIGIGSDVYTVHEGAYHEGESLESVHASKEGAEERLRKITAKKCGGSEYHGQLEESFRNGQLFAETSASDSYWYVKQSSLEK